MAASTRAADTRNATRIFVAFLAVAVLVIAWFPYRERTNALAALDHKAENQAALVAYTIAPAIEFGDPEMVSEVLRGASRDVDFLGAVVRDAEGTEIASHGVLRRGDDSVVTTTAIETMGNRVGTLELAMSTARIRRQSQEQFLVSAAIGVTIALLGAFVAYGVARSIRRIEALTEENVRARAAAEQAEIKSRVLAHVSHEIRTPLNGVLGLTDVLSRRALDPQSSALAASIVRSARNLVSLVNDVLDLSKLEAGRMELEIAPFDPEAAALAVCESLISTARSRELALVLDVGADVPTRVSGDRLRFEQILTNLVGNALKFTPPRGRVAVVMSWSDDRLDVAVRDTGIGISPGAIGSIFEAFAQADASTTRRFGGTGLGLTITRELVRKMGGEITVTSVEGEGSTFSFHVAAPAVERRAAAPVEEPPAQLLVVAADAEVGAILVAHAGRCGVEASAVGADALLAALDGRAGLVAVIWDAALGQPAPALRDALAREAGGGRARVVVHASVVDDAGIDGVATRALPAPFSHESFARAISRAPAQASADTVAEIDPELRVLVADDDATNRLVVGSFLAELGLRADMVEDGEQALARIEEGGRYDVILMDCQMPVLDGYETARRVRALEARTGAPRAPIVAVTAHAVAAEEARARAAGMDGYVTKPLTMERFLGALRELVPGAIVAGREAPPRASARARSREVAAAFRRSADECLAAIEDSLARKDFDALARHAHRIKGSCLSVGAADVASLAAELEARAVARDDARSAELAVELEVGLVDAGARLDAPPPAA